MFERLKNSKLAYVITLSACLNGVVGCGYFNGIWDTKYYKFQPTFEDRAVARTMITEQIELIDKSLKEMEPFLKKTTLDDNSKKDVIKKALTDMVNSANKGVKTEEDKTKKHNEVVAACLATIDSHIEITNSKNKDEIKEILNKLAQDWVGYEDKTYTVNGMEFHVKDNCIYFDKLEISVPLYDIKVSDADVIGFSSDIQKALRWRMDTSRRVRLGSGSAQILAAAAGASLGLATGSVATAAALAAFSAVIPEMQNIFQARDRSVAYEQGLEMIQDSESRYYQSRTANTSIGTVSTTELTPAGGKLLVEISACLKVVDKALLQTIPTIEELQAAKGRLDEALGKIKVVPTSLDIAIEGTQTVHIINSKAIAYAVSNAKVVEVVNFDPDKATEQIAIKGIGQGSAKVTVYNALGHSGYFDVTVGVVGKLLVLTAPATKVGTTTATLNGTVTTNCSPTDMLFEYGTTDGPPFGSSTTKRYTDMGTFPVTADISNLSSGKLYNFRVVGSSTAKPISIPGEVESFLTSNVTTGTATVRSETSADLTGEVITQEKTMVCCFTYGTVSGEKIDKSNLWVNATMKEKKGSSNQVRKEITDGLTPGTCYYYSFFAKNDSGEITGGEKSFTTKGTSVQTGSAKISDTKTVTLSGTVTTGSPSVKVWFDYGKEAGVYSDKISAKPETITTLTPTPVTADISSLTSGKYHFRIATEKVQGTDVPFEIK